MSSVGTKTEGGAGAVEPVRAALGAGSVATGGGGSGGGRRPQAPTITDAMTSSEVPSRRELEGLIPDTVSPLDFFAVFLLLAPRAHGWVPR